jgi:hypothetical protein
MVINSTNINKTNKHGDGDQGRTQDFKLGGST